MKRKITYLILFCVAIIGTSHAQQLPLSSHYMVNHYSVDPGFAGIYDRASVMLNYRKDYTNISGAPQTFRLNGFGKIFTNMYLGGSLISDKIDIFQRFIANLNYTYRLQMSNDQFLSFSLTGSFYQTIVRVDQAIGDLNDPYFVDSDRIARSKVNAGLSIVYDNPYIKVGIGLPVLFRLKSDESITDNEMYVYERVFQFHLSNDYNLSEHWQLQPFVLYQKTNNEKGFLDVSATMIYNEKVWLTALYRNSEGSRLGLGVGGEFKNVVLNYSYEFGMSSISNTWGGSHEITIGWRLPKIETGKTVSKQKKNYKAKSKDSRWGDVTPVEYDQRRLHK